MMTKPDRASALEAALLDQKEVMDKTEDLMWDTLVRRVIQENVVPIISNSFRNDRIFEDPSGIPQDVNQIISRAWAARLKYPLPDKHRLEQVANYNRVKWAKDDEEAKTNYLTFLKEALLLWASRDEKVKPLVQSLRDRIAKLSFPDLAAELEFPKFKPTENDPLMTLAQLPIKIFITTSFYDFLERALILKNKKPKTQICFWSGAIPNVADEHQTDYRPKPSVDQPIVYHIHGFEKYPRSIVISEDDHLDFLVKVSQDTDTVNPIIPLYIREALASESLILLGYRLHDWDFRSLFRGVINASHNKLRLESIVLQLDPDDPSQIGQIDPVNTKSYLDQYFEPSSFRVVWQDASSFIDELWQRYDPRRQN
jgi:hypothetical protein